MYDENILSQMRYGSIAWGNAKSSDKINKIQEKALVTMTGTSNGLLSALEGELGIMNLENLKNMELAKFYLKLQNMSEDRIYSSFVGNLPWISNLIPSTFSQRRRGSGASGERSSKLPKAPPSHVWVICVIGMPPCLGAVLFGPLYSLHPLRPSCPS